MWKLFNKGSKNIRKPSFLKRCFLWFFHNSHIVLFVAIVAFGRKQFIMWPLPWNVLLLQTLNNDETVLFISTYKKIKKHSWHYRIRKVLKRASGNSLKESYYCTLFSCAADVCTLPEILFSGFLWESIWNFFFCWGNSTRVGSSWGSADFQWILLHNFLVRNWH